MITCVRNFWRHFLLIFIFFFPWNSSGEFPGLQTRMRAVLRVEVEAVKFLKEEPHKLDSMLKRVKTLTDTLSNMRRYAEK